MSPEDGPSPRKRSSPGEPHRRRRTQWGHARIGSSLYDITSFVLV